MIEALYKIMFGIIKKMFIIFLTSTINASNHTKCISLNNQKCEIQSTLINLHPREYSYSYYPKEYKCYAFAVKLNTSGGSCNILHDLSNKVCVANKTEDLNINVFNMITGKNESKMLKDISCECKCKFDGRKCN